MVTKKKTIIIIDSIGLIDGTQIINNKLLKAHKGYGWKYLNTINYSIAYIYIIFGWKNQPVFKNICYYTKIIFYMVSCSNFNQEKKNE